MKDEDSRTPGQTLVERVRQDLQACSKWRDDVREIRLRRMAIRQKQRNYPYKGAPNFVVRIIDDNVREKTEQEISLLWNAPRIAYAVGLDPSVTSDDKSKIMQGFDCYFRFILKGRAKVEEGMDMKNEIGFSIFKRVRKYNTILRRDIPDFEVIDPLDIILPPDCVRYEICEAERITHILRFTKHDLRKKAQARGWKNVDAIIDRMASDDNQTGEDGGNQWGNVKEKVGITTSGRNSETFVVWEIYHYATAADVAWERAHQPDADLRGIEEGRKIRTTICPDEPDLVLSKTAWREDDYFEPPTEEELLLAMMSGLPPPEPRRVTPPDDPWPFAYAGFESRSKYVYDSRGGGQLLIDEQVAATALQNAKYTMMDYYCNPLLRDTAGRGQSSNVSFQPGSVLPQGLEFEQPPQIPQSISFEINALTATAGRRMGAGSQYNFSTDLGARKVEKTAREVINEEARTNQVSSVSVDRLNDPLQDLFNGLWEDMRRDRVPFPLFEPQSDVQGMFSDSLYDLPVLLIPAAAAKTLNPDIQLQKNLALAGWLLPLASSGMAMVDPSKVTLDIVTQYDPMLARTWFFDPKAQGPGQLPPVYQLLQQLMQQSQAVGQNVEQQGEGLQSTMKLALETSEKVDGMAVQKAPGNPG